MTMLNHQTAGNPPLGTVNNAYVGAVAAQDRILSEIAEEDSISMVSDK